MSGLEGRSLIITGAASGIGAEAARRAASGGARVTLADLSADAGERVVGEIRQAGGEAQFVRTDISEEDDVRRLVESAVERYGALHGAFNNAGVAPFSSVGNGWHPLAELPTPALLRSLKVNVIGTFYSMKHEIPAILASGGGAIVNTSSANGLVAIPNSAEYIAAKHAVIGLTKAGALDYATRGVRVNAVLPGIIDTPMLAAAVGPDVDLQGAFAGAMPIGRLGRPGEVADAALFLLTDAASLITGASISVDGGQTVI
jgi:2,5-dichloro-2,5-cyclohexadiene-1,4-diol dehydrogenase 1